MKIAECARFGSEAIWRRDEEFYARPAFIRLLVLLRCLFVAVNLREHSVLQLRDHLPMGLLGDVMTRHAV